MFDELSVDNRVTKQLASTGRQPAFDCPMASDAEQQISLDIYGGPGDKSPFRWCSPKSSPAMSDIDPAEHAVVYVVDDDRSMRDALAALFDTVGLRTEKFATAHQFLAARHGDHAGCIVIDVRLPDMNGLDVQAQLARLGIMLPVVMMTGYGDILMSVRAMKNGAVDFLPKPFHDQDMLDAVIAAVGRDRRRRSVEREVGQLGKRFACLTAREQEVMELVTAGKMNKQVAGELGISEITVKIHRGSTMRKMGARTLADLVRMNDALKPKRPPS